MAKESRKRFIKNAAETGIEATDRATDIRNRALAADPWSFNPADRQIGQVDPRAFGLGKTGTGFISDLNQRALEAGNIGELSLDPAIRQSQLDIMGQMGQIGAGDELSGLAQDATSSGIGGQLSGLAGGLAGPGSGAEYTGLATQARGLSDTAGFDSFSQNALQAGAGQDLRALAGQTAPGQGGRFDEFSQRLMDSGSRIDPSLAQLQLQEGTDAAISAQRAMAASSEGLNPAMAARLSAQGAGTALQASARDASRIRMMEQIDQRQREMAAIQGASDIYGRGRETRLGEREAAARMISEGGTQDLSGVQTAAGIYGQGQGQALNALNTSAGILGQRGQEEIGRATAASDIFGAGEDFRLRGISTAGDLYGRQADIGLNALSAAGGMATSARGQDIGVADANLRNALTAQGQALTAQTNAASMMSADDQFRANQRLMREEAERRGRLDVYGMTQDASNNAVSAIAGAPPPKQGFFDKYGGALIGAGGAMAGTLLAGPAGGAVGSQAGQFVGGGSQPTNYNTGLVGR